MSQPIWKEPLFLRAIAIFLFLTGLPWAILSLGKLNEISFYGDPPYSAIQPLGFGLFFGLIAAIASLTIRFDLVSIRKVGFSAFVFIGGIVFIMVSAVLSPSAGLAAGAIVVLGGGALLMIGTATLATAVLSRFQHRNRLIGFGILILMQIAVIVARYSPIRREYTAKRRCANQDAYACWYLAEHLAERGNYAALLKTMEEPCFNFPVEQMKEGSVSIVSQCCYKLALAKRRVGDFEGAEIAMKRGCAFDHPGGCSAAGALMHE